MPIAINGSGTVTGISAGGLPDATITPAELTQPLTLGTAQASTAGTEIDFTGIPSWAKRITVMFNRVSTNGLSDVQVQLGSTTFTTTGYTGFYGFLATSTVSGTGSATSGFLLRADSALNNLSGFVQVVNVTGNTWAASVSAGSAASNCCVLGGGVSPNLPGTLDRIRITTVNGTDTFDAGSINILYE